MTNQPGIHYLHDRPVPVARGATTKTMQKIRKTVTAGLSDLLQGTFDSVDDSFFELANNARSNNEQNRFFEAMREVRIKRKGIEKRFQEGLHNLFENPPGPGPSGPPTNGGVTADSLLLVSNDALEEQIAIDAMVNKAKAHFQSSLFQLQERFSELYARPADEPANPLTPEHLCSVLLDSIVGLDIQIRERLIVLKQFDRYVIANLGMLLDEANRIMVQSGIVPNFKHRGKNPGSAGVNSTAEASSGSPLSDEGEDSFKVIRQLLAQSDSRRLSVPAGLTSDFHLVNGGELYALLLRLPPHPASPDLTHGKPVVLDLRQIVAELLLEQQTRGGRSAAVAAMDEDLINLVAMLFEFILADANLSAPVQVMISRLQIPILKLVIKDRTFFSKPSHPARRLLNSLARAGIGWCESGEKSRDKLYQEIHKVVQTILEEYDGNIELFETLDREFEQFMARENRRATLVEQRTRESERGRIKSRQAQETVDRILSDKLSAQPVPESIRNILQNGWSRVMFLAYLRDNNEHRWTETVRAVDDLIWCLQPQSGKSERAHWARLAPPLLRTLRTGLGEVSYDAVRLDEMVADLKRELTAAFRQQRPRESKHAPINPQAPPHTAVRRQQELEDAALSEHGRAIEEIGIGTWVEFSPVDGTHLRCKLSAIIEEADSYVFVNRMGLKVIEKKRTDLVHDLGRGRLAVLEQGALIDRALDSIVSRLRGKAG